MTRALLCAAVLAVAAPFASAATAPTYDIEDFSTAALIDKPTVMAAWKEALPTERLVKLYPKAKWGFLSQVEGGVVDGKLCVVTARVTLLPKTSPTRRFVWEPAKSSTVFDGRPVASAAECSALAQDRLKDALRSLVSSLVKS
ncbi:MULTISPECIES: hypothetical protein [Rubrivivax]|uniref:Uncharacterized protein n=1 Tax=Rubrivivax benzoatilyticus TaxID=316997 RepID=A0ABX0HWC7_9BURK|nr:MULTISPECIES: hypothetical protein [Rubrivivax]EGJ09589.1 hypothetical protein RBXJA2T_04638 [Rubrivivax benzoatilyticus JA2 = ATCC BAA-35]MCD0423003.1 hypothetical protein [Rubrivivax sp. JA1024]NHK98611.1 hypothetical protein [Rubrivivax benzoatilyticus]NHL24113.1 hypothetical protein [Rubrivivax benzoatilyticus]